MVFRAYTEQDETGWIRCRLLSFLDCTYFDDVKKEKDRYENPSISLVAEEKGVITGFIEAEYELEEGEVCYLKGGKGAVIWNLGVLPEYRKEGIASKLFEILLERLKEKGIKRIELWTQDDEAANSWYQKKGFVQREAYLNAFVRGSLKDEAVRRLVSPEGIGEIYGVRNFNFEAPVTRKEELLSICYRLHEVRLYELILS